MDLHLNTADFGPLVIRLRGRAQRLGLQPCDAEDMAQEAILRLMQRMERSHVKAPENYAMIILRNLAHARWRAHIELLELEEASASTPPLGDSRLALDTLRRAIAALPAEQACVMELVLHGECSPRAIAARLDVPEGTVMSRLARARATLRRVIGLETGMPVADLL